jgi:hypothetical protein
VFRHRETSERDVGSPLRSLDAFTTHRPADRAYNEQKRIRRSRWHRRADVLPMGVRFRRWTLGFRQCSFSHIAQALQGTAVHVFPQSPLSKQALVPSSFRTQVKSVASESVALNSGHLQWRFLCA